MAKMGLMWALLEPTAVVLDNGTRRCKSLFWRVRAEIRRQVKAQRSFRRRGLVCNYDPLSYALNFDNGGSGFFC